MEDQKPKNNVVHTIRVSGMFNTPPSQDEINAAMKEFERLQRYLRWVPAIFIGVTFVILIFLTRLFELKFSAFVLVVMSTIMILKELSTLAFSIQMRNRVMKPIEKLRVAVDEISKGHYGYQVEEEPGNLVGDLITSFNKMSCELKEANAKNEKYERNRKELIAGISHDLKTPITSIVGYVDAIQSGVANSDEKRNTYLSIIGSNAQYTNKLIDDLFLFSKLDINQMKYEFVDMPIKDFLTDVIIEKQLELEESGVNVSFKMDVSDSMHLPLDGKMVYRIMSNILSNAVKYGDPDQPTIIIEADEIEEGVKVAITDNGKGISKNELKQIFDVFYRADSSRNKDIGGSGLGLAIAKQLVEAHGGTIGATSVVGKGTTITFTLKKQEEEEHNG